LSKQEKLQAIAELLKQYRWSFTDFLKAWVQEVDNHGQQIRIDHRGFVTPKKRYRRLLHEQLPLLLSNKSVVDLG
jgi:DnaJ-domain-containing protein 1